MAQDMTGFGECVVQTYKVHPAVAGDWVLSMSIKSIMLLKSIVQIFYVLADFFLSACPNNLLREVC